MMHFVAVDALSLSIGMTRLDAVQVFDWQWVTAHMADGAAIVWEAINAGRTWQSAYTTASFDRFGHSRKNRDARHNGSEAVEHIGTDNYEVMVWQDDSDDDSERIGQAIKYVATENEFAAICIEEKLQGLKSVEIATRHGVSEAYVSGCIKKAIAMMTYWMECNEDS